MLAIEHGETGVVLALPWPVAPGGGDGDAGRGTAGTAILGEGWPASGEVMFGPGVVKGKSVIPCPGWPESWMGLTGTQ